MRHLQAVDATKCPMPASPFDFRNSGALRQRYDSLKYVVKRTFDSKPEPGCGSHVIAMSYLTTQVAIPGRMLLAAAWTDGESEASPSPHPHLDEPGNIRLARRAGRVGLENLGNTCFMNAGLQCLSHIEPFAAFFLSGRYAGEINATNRMGSKGQLAETFAELQKVLWQSERPAQNPSEIKRRLATIAPHLFQGYQQQDVQEFLAFCLDGLHEDLSRISEQLPPRTEADEEADEKSCQGRSEEFAAALAWMRYLERSKSFLVDMMQGQLRSSLCCLRCGHKSRKFEPFMYLSLPVKQEMCSVSDAMREYTKEEVLSDDEKWKCEKCKAKVDAKKKIDLWQLPPVLVIHLKRFEFDVRSGYFRKITTPLACDLTTDLSSFCSSKQQQGALYSVACVANHSGAYSMGHYTATCRVGDKWYRFNDDRVSRQPPDEPVVGESAYILFLVRRSLEDGSYSAGHNSPLLKQQTMTMPELWPHHGPNQVSQDILSGLFRQPTCLQHEKHMTSPVS
eukprot:s85_g27.t1